MKHTKAPWVIDWREPVAVYEDDSSGRTICLAGNPSLPPRKTETTVANMQLISAAPELLESLKEIMAEYSRKVYKLDWSEAYTKAEAAIAKAEGTL